MLFLDISKMGKKMSAGLKVSQNTVFFALYNGAILT